VRIKIIAVGKAKNNLYEPLIKEYLKRNKWQIEIIEVESKLKSGSTKLKDESSLLLSKLSHDDYVILLDLNGRNLSTEQVSIKLQRLAQDNREIVFIIGGSDGFTNQVAERADLRIAFGQITLPHMLARVVLLEQLYRCWTIEQGKKYHK